MSFSSNEASLHQISEASGYVGYVWDITSDKMRWFGAWQELFGPSLSTPPSDSRAFLSYVTYDDRAALLNTAEATFDRDFRLQPPGKTTFWAHTHGVTHYENGVPVLQEGLVCPRFVAPNAGADKQATTDPLTGRLNRAGLQAALERFMSAATLDPRATYFVVGIDKMAFLNEALGPKAIDVLLCDIAARLQSLGPSDMQIGRVSGDMFGLLLSGKNTSSPEHMARQILGSFQDTSFNSPLGPLHLQVSIGSALFNQQDGSAREIMIRAEQALRDARNKGRGRHETYLSSPARSEEKRHILEIGEKVQDALKNDHLHLAYQPIVDAQTGEVLFYEALARLFRDDGQLMLAADFIPVVEQQGLAPLFDRHVLNLAVRELDRSENVRLAVNISGLTASLPDWPDYMRKLLEQRPHVAERLIIEITETAEILQVAETKVLVDSIRSLGGQVAIDDFGAGSTSIRHLRSLSLAIMKIDKDLLNNILTSPEQQHLVRMLISIARGLGLKTVVEGIETPEVAAWLRQERADMLQGFYFGYPSLEKPWVANPHPIFLTGQVVKPGEERRP